MNSDLNEIRNLVSDLAWHIDRGNTEPALALFAEGAFLDTSAVGGGRLEGVSGIRSFMEGTYQRAPQRLHLVSNHVVKIDGDRAAGRCVGLAYTKSPAGVNSLAGVAYEDVYVRTADGWRIASRAVQVLVLPG